MRMNEGVEWALHSCVNMTWLDPEEAITAKKLAAFYELPAAYLNKQLQSLVKAGILTSISGPRGGFRLARRPDQITLLDIVTAIEGREDAFRCEGILRKGPGGRDDVDYRAHCEISVAMRQADLAWRTSLAGRTVADIAATVQRKHPRTREGTRARFESLRT
ncbi:RrF2 family transcriptional regulator [Nonomuraea sp. NPDC050547]|uniref:RrF2 family transcriptional regulator n=1 Tax=unclassified Nonomuraea TaxID=2593643 RepID=UPI0037957349